jgi:hypothetical protein
MGLLLGPLEIGTEEDVDGALEEVQQLVLSGMHFPLVAHTGRLHGENTDVPTIELDGEKLN